MSRAIVTFTVVVMLVSGAGIVVADKAEEGSGGGVVHERHELMEDIGKQAKQIGDALKTDKHEPIEHAAAQIQASAAKILGLFPKGSTDAKSRAKPEIWEDWAKFEKLSKDLETTAGALAAAAKSGGDVGAAANAMFGSCKSCHDSFRKPEEKKDGKS